MGSMGNGAKIEASSDPDIKISARIINSLHCDGIIAKLWKVAAPAIIFREPPTLYPEFTQRDSGSYVYRDLRFWTSGFFPGSLYLLRERQIKYPQLFKSKSSMPHPLVLQHLCRWWTDNLHQNAFRNDTHDLGFMICPSKCLRSWDKCHTRRYSFSGPSKDFLLIIDNMANLELLFWAAKETCDSKLYEIASAHAKTTQKHHILEDRTTYHVVNYDTVTGQPKAKFTNQGYSDDSCWAHVEFLITACNLADYFIAQLNDDHVPLWDFAAPPGDSPPPDTSAGMIAACGMVLIYKSLEEAHFDAAVAEKNSRLYITAALQVLEGTIAKHFSHPELRLQTATSKSTMLVWNDDSQITEQKYEGSGMFNVALIDSESRPGSTKDAGDTILDGATINNYEYAPRRWTNHGLVYADYYFIWLGNLLLDLDIVPGILLI
ncbi:MAG: glycoside hydrolase family 88 protein [Acidomyces sp. 'richmondensis']|nr:MAG: glycoside hydrolase family 88 protein [Acidomyces sp. 'richmondensis']